MTSGLWCSRCGHPAELLGPSIDPDHPLVLCQRVNGAGYIAHPDPQPGILDSAELGQVMQAHRRADLRRVHAGHTHHLVRGCPHCDAMHASLFA